MNTAILLFHQTFRRSVGEGAVHSHHLTACLSALGSLDPFQTGKNLDYGFLWITDFLNSRYPDRERYSAASRVLQLLGKHLGSIVRQVGPSWVSPLVDFLSLGEQFYSTESTPYPGLLALKIISSTPKNLDLSTTILPILASTLVPTHPLRSRRLALRIFRKLVVGWTSSQMENVPNNHLDQLLQAVGDPFQFPDLPLRDGQPLVTADYDPMEIAVILIGFASSDLWRNHLRRSNFASCEEILSTNEGKRAVFRPMFKTATHRWLELLHTPTAIIAAIRRLEELQCPNTAEVVILWAWTAGVVNVMGCAGWGSIERNTLIFYQTHGMRRLTALSRQITDTTMKYSHLMCILTRNQGPPCRAGGVQQLVPWAEAVQRWDRQDFGVLRVAQACQLRRLYQLFGYDPTTWKEVVDTEVGGETSAFSGQSVTRTQLTDWVCDYP